MNKNKLFLIAIMTIILMGYYKLNAQPLGWDFVKTKQNHSILIHTAEPFNALVTIDGKSIETGDYIGVFFSKSDSLVCGGYAQWGTIIEGSCQIPVWGDNPETPEKDGFAVGESFKFFIYRNNDVECREVNVSIEQFGPFTSELKWEENGNTSIRTLEATCSPKLK